MRVEHRIKPVSLLQVTIASLVGSALGVVAVVGGLLCYLRVLG